MTTALLLASLLWSAGALAQDAPPPGPPSQASSDAGVGVLPTPHPTALIQGWITAYDMDEDPQADPASYGDPEDDPGIKARRVRLGAEGASDVLRYAVTVGYSAPFDALTQPGDEY